MPLASNWNAQGVSYNAILLESGVAYSSQRTARPGLLIYYYRGMSNYLTPNGVWRLREGDTYADYEDKERPAVKASFFNYFQKVIQVHAQ